MPEVFGAPDTGWTIRNRSYPQLIKYMGSKARIADFVTEGIRGAYRGGYVCDLFAGACTLSGVIGHSVPMVSNDIQTYSKVLAHAYLHKLSKPALALNGAAIIEEAAEIIEHAAKSLPEGLSYPASSQLCEFNEIEARNRALIDLEFSHSYHLFTKYYAGTWWSAEQCLWIDALRQVADRYAHQRTINEGDHAVLLTCVMHAMAYCGQGTGHYAQYRDAKTASSLKDINLYRQKSIAAYFSRKLTTLQEWNAENVADDKPHKILSLDYAACLDQLDGGTVYADPPYAFVHYSRFYHAIETFVLYDYPDLQIKGGRVVKGRYREERHQSPFCIRSQVPYAFKVLFDGVERCGANLVLSYSNSGLFSLPALVDLANACLGKQYEISILNTDHTHMTMGRREDRNRDVEEALLLATRL